MKKQKPLYATLRTAAALLDMKPGEFEKLVRAGHLPKPLDIGESFERWDVQQLQAIISGSASLGEELEW